MQDLEEIYSTDPDETAEAMRWKEAGWDWETRSAFANEILAGFDRDMKTAASEFYRGIDRIRGKNE